MEPTQNQTPNSAPVSQGFLSQIENEIGKVYAKITFHLPAGLKEFIVHYGPWITLILMVIAIPAVLLALGLSAVAIPAVTMYSGAKVGGMFFVSGIIALFALILEAIALPGLFKRQIGGWRLLFYSVLVSAVGNLLSMNLGGLIIGTALSLYVLYEVKSYYK
jgi:hypothetical protein